jgi:heptosyltransferase-2
MPYYLFRLLIIDRERAASVFEGLPFVRRLFVFSKKSYFNIRQIRKITKILKKEKYEHGLLLPNSFSSGFVFRLSRIENIYGYSLDGRGFMLSYRFRPHTDYKNQHHVFYYLYLINQMLNKSSLDYADVNPEKYPLVWKILEEETKEAKRILGDLGIDCHRLIGICPGASYGPAKRWPKERFLKLAEILIKEYKYQIILLGGLEDRDIALYIENNAPKGIFNFTGKTSLRISAAIMKLSQMIIANDSGPMHLAAAVNTPLVAIFGSTDIIRTSPWVNNCKIIYKSLSCSPCFDTHCRYKHYNCLRNINIEDVLEAVDKILV